MGGALMQRVVFSGMSVPDGGVVIAQPEDQYADLGHYHP
jgi:hypothetical protein